MAKAVVKLNDLAESQKTIIVVPVVVAPVQVQLALVVPAVEISDVPIAVRIPPIGTNLYDTPSMPPAVEYSLACI